MKAPIMDTPFRVATSQVRRSQSSVKPRFFPFYRLAKLIVLVNCVLHQYQQLGSSVRELNDKYLDSCLCLLQHWNRELYTIMLTVGMIFLEHPTSGVVLKLFRPAKSKIYQDWTISFVGIISLVTGLSEGKERLQHRNVWST